jgi:hypothetical protein
MRALPLVELTIARIARTRVLYSTAVSSSSCRTNTFCHLPTLFFFFFFFVTCTSPSMVGEKIEIFVLFLWHPAMTASRILHFHSRKFIFLKRTHSECSSYKP